VLVLGVGTGNTLGAISLHRPDELMAVDLIAGVLDLAKKNFGDTNYHVLEREGVQVINADALRVVRASPHKYDVIIADLFHPWQAGVGSLYSREHFEAARGALSQGGIFCQWLPLYQLSGENLRTIIRTFISVYPEASAWLGNFGSQTPALALVGSESAVHLYWKRWEESLADAELRAGMSNVYLDRAAEIVGGYIAARGELESFAGEGAINRTYYRVQRAGDTILRRFRRVKA
jgi:spermidine synthase